ncbi:MAG: 3'-5' exonuclease [Candidatus Scatosoma sp.]
MDESDYVTLATVHAVKGLEFKCVFVTGLEENVLPTSRANDDEEALEEERRVMYVAVTRAKERLYLTRSKSRFLYGKRESTVRSRFLSELSSVVDLPEERRAEHGGYGAYDGYDSGSSYGGRGDYGGYRKTYGGYGVSYGNSSYAAATRDSAPVRSTYKPAYGGGNKSTYGGNAAYGADTYGKTAGTANTSSTGGAFTYGGVGFKTPAAKQGKTDVSALKEGVRVSHPKFGTGVIVKRSGYERNVILHVAFEGYGIKQLSAVLAPLKIL